MLSNGILTGLRGAPALFCMVFFAVSCKVYTIDKSEFEQGLKKKQTRQNGISVSKLHVKQFKNQLDTIVCSDENGAMMRKRVSQDAKIRIYTKKQKAIKFYAKTLYIYKNEYLIGERTAPKLYGPNYFPIKLSEIDKIEYTGFF